MLSLMKYRTLIQHAAAAGALGACLAAQAGDIAWTQEKISPAINYAGREVTVRYAPIASRPGGSPKPGGAITAVYATRDFQGAAAVHSKLCWNGMQRCVPFAGAGVRSKDFNGLDPRQPFYLIHTVQGKGPLPQPLFVKGSVTVWYR